MVKLSGSIIRVFFLCLIIRTCHKNMSLYQVLQLQKEVDISVVGQYAQEFGINERIKELVENIKLDYEINITSPEAYRLLLSLAQSKLNTMDFSAYTNIVGFFENTSSNLHFIEDLSDYFELLQIGEKITSIDLVQLAAAINVTASKLPSSYTNVSNLVYACKITDSN